MMKIIALFIAVYLFTGCSSKSEYKPQKVLSTLSYSNNMRTELRDVSRDGATYEDGKVLSKKRGLIKYKLEKAYRFLYDSGHLIVATKEDGMVKVFSEDKTIFEKKFDYPVASASLRKDRLALVLSNNTLVLYDIKGDKEIFREALEPTFANDARLANPLFLKELVIFPTLDGRLYIVNTLKNIAVRDISVSNQELFNNIIFLEEKKDILVTATASKVVVITPKAIETKRIDVKDVLYGNGVLYIFTKTGKVIKTDLKLKTIKEIKFPFAHFSVVTMSDKIYMVEKSGYVIEIDKALQSPKVYALPSEINKPVYAFKNRLFFGQHFLKLQ